MSYSYARPVIVASAPAPLRYGWLWFGFLVLGGTWLGPLPAWSGELFLAHMAMHVAVVALAAPVLALAVAGSRWDPSRTWPRLFSPLPASALELVVIWAWHAPALHELARMQLWARTLEQGSFLAVGLLLWLSAFGGAAETRTRRNAAGIGGLLMTSMHMTLLGALLAVAPRSLYSHHHAGMFGLSGLEDQHWGGVLMLLGGGIAYLLGGLYLLWLVMHPRTASERSA